MSITAVVLAAGGSSRLGEPKQLLRYPGGETLVRRAAREAREAGATEVIVVVGAEVGSVRTDVADVALIVENDAWATGVASSIVAGVRAAILHDAQSLSAVLLTTCDMPTVGAAHLRALIAASADGRIRVASAYGATRGIPAVLPVADTDDLLALTGDRGAKALLMREDTVLVSLDGGTFDLDTPADVARWRAALGTGLG